MHSPLKTFCSNNSLSVHPQSSSVVNCNDRLSVATNSSCRPLVVMEMWMLVASVYEQYDMLVSVFCNDCICLSGWDWKMLWLGDGVKEWALVVTIFFCIYDYTCACAWAACPDIWASALVQSFFIISSSPLVNVLYSSIIHPIHSFHTTHWQNLTAFHLPENPCISSLTIDACVPHRYWFVPRQRVVWFHDPHPVWQPQHEPLVWTRSEATVHGNGPCVGEKPHWPHGQPVCPWRMTDPVRSQWSVEDHCPLHHPCQERWYGGSVVAVDDDITNNNNCIRVSRRREHRNMYTFQPSPMWWLCMGGWLGTMHGTSSFPTHTWPAWQRRRRWRQWWSHPYTSSATATSDTVHTYVKWSRTGSTIPLVSPIPVLVSTPRRMRHDRPAVLCTQCACAHCVVHDTRPTRPCEAIHWVEWRAGVVTTWWYLCNKHNTIKTTCSEKQNTENNMLLWAKWIQQKQFLSCGMFWHPTHGGVNLCGWFCVFAAWTTMCTDTKNIHTVCPVSSRYALGKLGIAFEVDSC